MNAHTTTLQQPAGNILVFDSGVGGLSLVEHIRHSLPAAAITYLADNALFPYGLLQESTLIERACQLIGDLCRQQQHDLVVVGCNSASTLILPHLRQQLSIPVVGVVPAIKPAAQLSHSKVIGLLATPGTVQREYTDEMIAEFAPHCTVIRVGSSPLVHAVEQQLSGNSVDAKLYQGIAEAFLQHPASAQLDTVVLACTHFPHARQALQQAMPQVNHWVDSGDAIARRVSHLLAQQPRRQQRQASPDTAYFTAPERLQRPLKDRLKQFGFQHTAAWQLPAPQLR